MFGNVPGPGACRALLTPFEVEGAPDSANVWTPALKTKKASLYHYMEPQCIHSEGSMPHREYLVANL